jgi:hypothetical protein
MHVYVNNLCMYMSVSASYYFAEPFDILVSGCMNEADSERGIHSYTLQDGELSEELLVRQKNSKVCYPTAVNYVQRNG